MGDFMSLCTCYVRRGEGGRESGWEMLVKETSASLFTVPGMEGCRIEPLVCVLRSRNVSSFTD